MAMQHPREWNEPTKMQHARHLATTMTTAGLREFQALNASQIRLAHKQRNTAALENLRAMADVYASAVNIREFPDA